MHKNTLNELANALLNTIQELEPNPIPNEYVEMKSISFDSYEEYQEFLVRYLNKAKTFEIHCWNEEEEWITLASRYGKIKRSNWQYGKVIEGEVTLEFTCMLLSLTKPQDTKIYNKMTPFFNIFLDDVFQSCHYGTEIYYR